MEPDVERPPLPATIRWAIVFLALQALGVLAWTALAFPSCAVGLGLMWLAAALGAIGGLVQRRPWSWGGAVGLLVGSLAVAVLAGAGAYLTTPARLPTASDGVALACGGGFLVPLALLLAGRRAYLDLTAGK